MGGAQRCAGEVEQGLCSQCPEGTREGSEVRGNFLLEFKREIWALICIRCDGDDIASNAVLPHYTSAATNCVETTERVAWVVAVLRPRVVAWVQRKPMQHRESDFVARLGGAPNWSAVLVEVTDPSQGHRCSVWMMPSDFFK